MTDDEIVEAMARAIDPEAWTVRDRALSRGTPEWSAYGNGFVERSFTAARAALAVARPMIEGPLKEALRAIRRHNDSPVNYDEHIDALARAALGATDER
jgi:hypothetical protein